ncbi:hypothetical protein [Rhodococcus sp. APC 3903]|nr:hypothetical protein [Rhodococcus sp. APC 3903]MDN3460697.1 hypothetical protein [Rhodococcus sp. APC 3903]
MTSVLPSPTDTPDIENASRDRISTLQLDAKILVREALKPASGEDS